MCALLCMCLCVFLCMCFTWGCIKKYNVQISLGEIIFVIIVTFDYIFHLKYTLILLHSLVSIWDYFFLSFLSHATQPMSITDFICIWLILFEEKNRLTQNLSYTKSRMFSRFPIFSNYFQSIAFCISIFIILDGYF